MSGGIVVAGANGALGREVLARLRARGRSVRALVRDPARLPAREGVDVHVGEALRPETLRGLCDGAEVVFSCLGASTMPSARGWRGFSAVDVPANRNLVEAARAAGARRFVYVSVCGAPGMPNIAYARAHERVVDAVKASGLSWGVVRPTGFFSAMDEILKMARRGWLPEVGRGLARTNPISDEDLADLCVELVLAEENLERDAGGPRTYSRHEISELAFRALGKPGKVRRIPAGLARAMAFFMRPLHPRIAQFMQFFAAIADQDLIGQPTGTRTLEDHFARRAAAWAQAAA